MEAEWETKHTEFKTILATINGDSNPSEMTLRVLQDTVNDLRDL